MSQPHRWVYHPGLDSSRLVPIDSHAKTEDTLPPPVIQEALEINVQDFPFRPSNPRQPFARDQFTHLVRPAQTQTECIGSGIAASSMLMLRDAGVYKSFRSRHLSDHDERGTEASV
jgi:hypothetical protein